jgi:predicted nucleotidyltransferase component of viral defense system
VIPLDYITEWRLRAPWPSDLLVEQDLVISRALVEIFQQEVVASTMAFRGGTALHKIHLREAARYSEDIDLVQIERGPIGPAIDAIRSVLDPWLGAPKRDVGGLGATLTYRFPSSGRPTSPLRLKVEINCREHVPAALGGEVHPFVVESRWFAGQAQVRTFELSELLGTKLRALYQRRKGRDLFDIGLALRETGADPARIVVAFERYMRAEGHSVSRREFESNLTEKLGNPDFIEDVAPLLGTAGRWEADRDVDAVRRLLLSRLA